MRRPVALMACLLALAAPGFATDDPDLAAREAEVRATEAAFAKTMVDRDLDAFATFIAEDAVFWGLGPLRGRAAIVAAWARYFEAETAPFAWEPADVAVTADGRLGLSRGPVHDPEGVRISTFVSTWRRETDGRWRIVLDCGCPPCEGTP